MYMMKTSRTQEFVWKNGVAASLKSELTPQRRQQVGKRGVRMTVRDHPTPGNLVQAVFFRS